MFRPGPRLLSLVLGVLMIGSCRTPPSSGSNQEIRLHVAVAASVSEVFRELAEEYESRHGTRPVLRTVLSTGSTLSLAQQIRHGAPFDLFVAADVSTPRKLAEDEFLIPETVRTYARGRLIVKYIPTLTPGVGKLKGVGKLEDLRNPEIRRVGIASPELAPYGRAAREVLQAKGLWNELQPKMVFGEHVKHVEQFLRTGNVEAAFLPLSLAGSKNYLLVDSSLHKPLDQALGIVKGTPHLEESRALADFILGLPGLEFLQRAGYQQNFPQER